MPLQFERRLSHGDRGHREAPGETHRSQRLPIRRGVVGRREGLQTQDGPPDVLLARHTRPGRAQRPAEEPHEARRGVAHYLLPDLRPAAHLPCARDYLLQHTGECLLF